MRLRGSLLRPQLRRSLSAQPSAAIPRVTVAAITLPYCCALKGASSSLKTKCYIFIFLQLLCRQLTLYNENILHVRACFIPGNYQRHGQCWACMSIYLH